MRLVTGPAGAGKTAHILDILRASLRDPSPDVRVLVPTATMAQHLQNQLARENFVFPPNLIQTLDSFLPCGIPQVSPAVLHLIVEQAALRTARPEFARVTRFHGFCNALARTIDEFAAAACDSERLAIVLPDVPLGDAFLAVYREVDAELARRGLSLRGRRLDLAAANLASHPLPGIRTILMDGFHALPDPELHVIAALAAHTELTITFNDDDLTPNLLARLLALGFNHERLPSRRPRAAFAVVKAPSIEREVEEIARRILTHAAARPFREIGIVVRPADIYLPALRSTLERFGIPARFYFDTPLERHPVVRFLSGAVEAMLADWDHARTLAVLRLAPRFADFNPADRFDFDVREQTPNAGLSELRAHLLGEEGQPRPGAERLLHKLDSIAAIEEWRGFLLTPLNWAARLATLRALFRPARPEFQSHELALQWRSQAVVLNRFEEALQEAAAALDPARELALDEFWRAVKSVLRLKSLRLPDGRRNVVHVISATESRQWSLPVIFLCGMVEKQFPRVHQQDPFFNDAARSRLNAAGIRVRTAQEFERQERGLFNAATSRATMLSTLSYPEFDARGERNLQSIYLEDLFQPAEDSVAVRPVPRALSTARAAAVIAAPDLLDYLRRRTSSLSPTALETFLQCPFQYFAARLMRLKTAPLRPEKRLSFLEQGNIVHEVLSAWWQQPQEITPLFERVFAQHLADVHIPNGYHTERLRNAMLDDLKRFTTQDAWPRAAFQSQTEVAFDFALTNEEITDLHIKGRIDRLDVAPDGRAYIIDYKYSAIQRVKDKLKNQNLMQAPLYMMAATALQARPAGMFYLGVKAGIEYAGWTESPLMDSLPLPENWLEAARSNTFRIVGEMRRGRIDVLPADSGSCGFCDARDICRVESADAVIQVEGA
ncbi:MAG: PD-(D/E)XK nuclease family protein [Candidatus Solibacter sp.]